MPPVAVKIRLQSAPRIVRRASRSLAEIAGDLSARKLRSAYERGLAEGGSIAARAAAARLDAAVEHFETARLEQETEATEFALRFAVEIARHLVRKEIAAGTHDVERIVRETLSQSGVDRGQCVVHLSPEDHATLHGVAFRSGTRLEADPTVARGDVHVTTPQGLFVREIDTILRSLLERLEGDRS